MEVPKEFASGNVRTFQFQDALPPLPQPDLDNTLDKYLESVRPVTTDDEYHQTELIVNSFRTGLGKTLHDKFLQRTSNKRNWLEELWERKAYLEGRYPTAPLINISGLGPYYHSVWPPAPGMQMERASIILYTSVLFWNLIRTEGLLPDPAGNGAVSCMNQYTRLFNTCKQPGLKEDTLKFFFKTDAEGACPSHVVVICRGRFFKIEVVHPGGDLLTPPELEVQLRHIREACDRSAAAPGLGALTGDNRTRWALNREYLLSLDPSHATYLLDIETAIITFVLEEAEPRNEHELCHVGLTGDPSNRWFDKSINQVVFRNGTVACNCDHAAFDGIAYIFATAFAELCLTRAGGKWKGSTQVRKVASPTELVFQYDDKLRSAIDVARNTFNELANDIELYNPMYKDYGKKFIRSFKLHPDAYIQMVLQLAYYRMHGKPAPTYETGTVRRFYHGRTETVRSCTVEALHFAKAMINRDTKPEKQLALFRAAMEKHIKNLGEATYLKGCDRHLLALAVLATDEGIPTPAIFTDPAFKKSGGDGNFVLSTSFVGYTPGMGGCAPMCDHGYGCFYSIQQDRVTFYLTSWVHNEDTDVRQLFASIAQSLNDIRALLEQSAAKSPKL